MTARSSLAAILSAAALVGVAWLAWVAVIPPPRLDRDRFERLAASGHFDAAEDLLRQQLRRSPGDPEANLRMAGLTLDRLGRGAPDAEARAKATKALEYLERVRPEGARMAALAQLYRGRALYVLDRWREVEAAFKEALRLDPTVPEAAWGLLDLYYLQGRTEDAIRLALRQYEAETDGRDRAQLLLELLRQDARPPAAASLIERFTPVVRADPDDTQSAAALGLAFILESRVDEGLRALTQAVERRPDDPVAWDGLLTGLEEAKEPDKLAQALGQLPAALADDPRFAEHRGRVAEDRRDWEAAIAAYRRAREFEPHSPKQVYLLARALRFAGQTDEAERLEAIDATYRKALPEGRSLYDEANANRTFGLLPNPDLYRRLADLRERMIRPEEARLWYRMVLRDTPKDPESLAALERLQSGVGSKKVGSRQ